MSTEDPVIYVSRKGSASSSIDADPEYRAIYLARERNRAAWRRTIARGIVLAGFGALCLLIYKLRA